MNVNFRDIRERLDTGKTISGMTVGEQYFGWDDLYMGTFYSKLLSVGFTSEIDLSNLLEQMNNYVCCGELADPKSQVAEVCALGLILFDRMVRAEVEEMSFEDVFDLHEDLVACLQAVTTGQDRAIQARKAAKIRHAKSNRAKAFVKEEWRQHKNVYKGNKTAFARHYVRRVKNEFGTTITQKQMQEVWLKDIPPASNPACLPADGE